MKLNPPHADRSTRSMVLKLTTEMADSLEYARYLRQKREGRPIPKKQLVIEAIDRFLKTFTAE